MGKRRKDKRVDTTFEEFEKALIEETTRVTYSDFPEAEAKRLELEEKGLAEEDVHKLHNLRDIMKASYGIKEGSSEEFEKSKLKRMFDSLREVMTLCQSMRSEKSQYFNTLKSYDQIIEKKERSEK